jgi:hypothetical protein
MTMSRYFRLMALALTEMSLNMPLGILAIVLNTRSKIEPWINWEDTHFDYGRVEQFPAVLWRNGSLEETQLELTRWLVPFCAFIFFAFFGFSEDARKRYTSVFKWIDGYARISKLLPLKRTSRYVRSSIYCLMFLISLPDSNLCSLDQKQGRQFQERQFFPSISLLLLSNVHTRCSSTYRTKPTAPRSLPTPTQSLCRSCRGNCLHHTLISPFHLASRRHRRQTSTPPLPIPHQRLQPRPLLGHCRTVRSSDECAFTQTRLTF